MRAKPVHGISVYTCGSPWGRSIILYRNHCIPAGGRAVPGRDSNPYGFLHQILSLARLPIPPPRQIAMLKNLAVLAAAGKLRL